MRKAEWLLAGVMLGLGMLCMTVSATTFLEKPSDSFLRTFFTLCVWIAVPLIIMGGIYVVVLHKRHHK